MCDVYAVGDSEASCVPCNLQMWGRGRILLRMSWSPNVASLSESLVYMLVGHTDSQERWWRILVSGRKMEYRLACAILIGVKGSADGSVYDWLSERMNGDIEGRVLGVVE